MSVNYNLHGLRFQWNEEKADGNMVKHGVAFEAACEVFFDPLLFPVEDEIIDSELRGVVVGLTSSWRLLCVVFTLRDDVIRIISARNVTRSERLDYENQ